MQELISTAILIATLFGGTYAVLPSKLNDIQKSIYLTMKVKTQLQKATIL